MARFEQRLTTLEWVCMQASRLPARLSSHTGGGKLCQELRAFHGVRLDAIRRVLVLHVESQFIVGSYPFFAGLRFPMQTGQGE
jgi:hypothetical protein